MNLIGWDKRRVTDHLHCDNEYMVFHVHKYLSTLVEQRVAVHLKRLGWDNSNERI